MAAKAAGMRRFFAVTLAGLAAATDCRVFTANASVAGSAPIPTGGGDETGAEATGATGVVGAGALGAEPGPPIGEPIPDADCCPILDACGDVAASHGRL